LEEKEMAAADEMRTWQVGDRIWRRICASVNGPFLTELECKRTDRGNFMFKADHGRGDFTDRMVAYGHQPRWGLVCFIDSPPEGNWTYLQIDRIGGRGNVVFVSAKYGALQELAAQYSRQIGNWRDLF
jgi:hypothetical protein